MMTHALNIRETEREGSIGREMEKGFVYFYEISLKNSTLNFPS